jgi:hypothetical protein
MDRYAVFLVGTAFYRLHSTHIDPQQAADDYNRITARTDAVLVRVGGPNRSTITVLAAGGTDPADVAADPMFIHAVHAAFGLQPP